MGDVGAAAVGLGLCEKRTVSRAGYGMKPRFIIEKPPAWSAYSNSIALDRLVEVALSSTDALDFRCRDNVATGDEHHPNPNQGNDKTGDKRTAAAPGSTNGEGDRGKDDDESAVKGRYCSSHCNVIKGTQHAAMAMAIAMAPSPSPSPSPSSAPYNHPPAGYYQQQQQKLKGRLSALNEISPPAGRTSSFRVHHHSKRFTPRFKSLVDIAC